MATPTNAKAPHPKQQINVDTVARPMIAGRWALMNRQETGLASSALIYDSLEDVANRWDIVIGEIGEDRFGPFVRILRTPARELPPVFAAIGVDDRRIVMGIGDSVDLAELAATEYMQAHPTACMIRVVPISRLQVARWSVGVVDPLELGLVP